ncbi:Aminopeptidase-like protein [Pseudomonas sp. 8Z]|uniref:aminopeptidase n=1 Tax=Pseudomonas sp. 8Z TaxID=2653166 RepID=UPI0012EFFD2B|nr:aminopeptidase [Pseudomonas sp. 8Z]VXC87081.1 Aminopeptidase-like protein [Pseudomonas sp. 8Z]
MPNTFLIDGLRRLGVPLLALLLGGCSTLDYYAHLGQGQWQLLQAREPITELLANPDTDPQLAKRLRLSQTARDFASAHLHLPDNRSYRLYADLHRPFVVWNVFATPEFSLDPELHCFPIAGCVAYRGYYQQGRARGAAALLRQHGLDTYIAGVEAYSTLGWFDDPLLSSMLQWNDERLVAVIFHELAHQQFYLPGDTAFNESFATFVEREGLRQWHAARGETPPLNDDRQRQQFIELVLASRERLRQLYASSLPEQDMRAAKQAEFARLRREYRALRQDEWGGQSRFDAWINSPLNNAKLLPFGLYDQWVPAFATLFAREQNNWPAFYAAVANLARLPQSERQIALQDLLPHGKN